MFSKRLYLAEFQIEKKKTFPKYISVYLATGNQAHFTQVIGLGVAS